MKQKICLVVQRYGLEVNGGAELQCRQMAEQLAKRYAEVHVLTTQAIDYMTWRNEYPSAQEELNGVVVHRFPVEKERVQRTFNAINSRFLLGGLDVSEEQEWVDKQGPYVPALLQYMKEHKAEYYVFLFFTYLYYPTVMGIGLVREKAIVVPEAHDEPFLRMKIFDNVFKLPRFFFFNTEEEQSLVYAKYHNQNIPSLIGGVGLDLPEKIDAEHFRKKYGLENYMVYVGRIDDGKNCTQLFEYFAEYKRRNSGDMKLVLIGKPVIKVPVRDDIVSLGFVDEQDKYDGIAGAQMLVLPSKNESLSIVVLEAMAVYTPVIVNGACPVLKGHCLKSNGAFYYNNYFEFEGEVNYLLTHPSEKQVLLENAKKYVDENYQWDVIIDKLSSLIEQI